MSTALPRNKFTIDRSDEATNKEHIKRLLTMTYEELIALRAASLAHKDPLKIPMYLIMAQIASTVKGERSVPMVLFEHVVHTIGVEQSVLETEGTVEYVYSGINKVKNEIGLGNAQKMPADRVVVDTRFGYPDHRPLTPLLKKMNMVVQPANLTYLNACRLIASYFKSEDLVWTTVINSGAPWSFPQQYIPTGLGEALSHISGIKLVGNMSGLPLYHYLTGIKEAEVQYLIMKSAACLAYRPLDLEVDENDDSVPYLKAVSVSDGRQDHVIEMVGRSATSLMIDYEVRPGEDLIATLHKKMMAADQKIGGSGFSTVNNEYVDGVHLNAPELSQRRFLKGLSNVVEIGKMGKILLICADTNLVSKTARVLMQLGYTKTLYVRGLPAESISVSGINIISGKTGFLTEEWDLIICKDKMTLPTMGKRDVSHTAYYSGIKKILSDSMADFGNNAVYLMAPYMHSDHIENFHIRHLPIFDPVFTHIPTILQKKSVQVRGTDSPAIKRVHAMGTEAIDLSSAMGYITTTHCFPLVDYYKLRMMAFCSLIQYPWTHMTLHRSISQTVPDLIGYLDSTTIRFYYGKSDVIAVDGGRMVVLIPGIGRLDAEDAKIISGDVRSLIQVGAEKLKNLVPPDLNIAEALPVKQKKGKGKNREIPIKLMPGRVTRMSEADFMDSDQDEEEQVSSSSSTE